jgi:stress-induced morphogen
LENLVIYSHFIVVLGGCGTFFAITIASKAFKGMPVVEQHRLINKVLQKEIEGIHGLQVTLFLFYLHFHIDPFFTQLKTVPL